MAKRTDIQKIPILGSGPVIIGAGSIGFERARLQGAPQDATEDSRL
jgi:hypothetical protein